MTAHFFVSSIDAIDGAETSIRDFAQQMGFDESDLYFIGLAAREIIVNAIKHGNCFDSTKKAEVRLFNDNRRLTIEVTDEGAGFKLEEVPDPHLAENLHRRSGRGLTMALASMDQIFVERQNPTGTLVRMVKMLPAA